MYREDSNQLKAAKVRDRDYRFVSSLSCIFFYVVFVFYRYYYYGN